MLSGEAAAPSGMSSAKPWLAAAAGVACFHVAYLVPHASLLVLGYAAGLLVFARHAGSPRRAFYGGLAAGIATVAPWLWFFLSIFGFAGAVLWGVVGVWTGVFAVLARAAFARLTPVRAALLAPFLWTGVEYFRSELYPLRFTWVTPGFAFAPDLPFSAPLALGVYGAGFGATALAAWILEKREWRRIGPLLVTFMMFAAGLPGAWPPGPAPESRKSFRVAGLQLEGVDAASIPARLDTLLKAHPDADLVVLQEYAFSGPIPKEVLDWCRARKRHLVAGGMDLLPDGNYRNTAFVVDPLGRVVFRQAKSVPIQFFQDGLPAESQALWDSPWGRIGICICYDLSYTRVVDRLVAMGAQALIVPTMDAAYWGGAQHRLHGRVAPVRAAEYRLPVVRVCSSGISQIVDPRGKVVASAPFPGIGATVAAEVRPVERGRIPPDRRLAPLCSAVAAAWAAWLVVEAVRRKRSSPPG